MDRKRMRELGKLMTVTGEYIKVVGGLIGDLFEHPSEERRRMARKEEKPKITLIESLNDDG